MQKFLIILALSALLVYVFAEEEAVSEDHHRFKRGGARCTALCASQSKGLEYGTCEKKKGNKSTTCGNNYVCVCKSILG